MDCTQLNCVRGTFQKWERMFGEKGDVAITIRNI